jgi:hypothetical protein
MANWKRTTGLQKQTFTIINMPPIQQIPWLSSLGNYKNSTSGNLEMCFLFKTNEW